MTTVPYATVLEKLRPLGLRRRQVEALLPSWWQPELGESAAGVWETVLLLGRRLHLDAAALAQGELLRLDREALPRFKHTARTRAEDLEAATLISTALSKAVLAALPAAPPVERLAVDEARALLLERPGSRIDFDRLLEVSWQLGIPVLPLPNLPTGVRHMDAAALRIGGRAAVVLARRRDSRAWLSFLLAHELGHLLLGHLAAEGSIVEGSLGDTAEFQAEAEIDRQEAEANAFALAILGGAEAEQVVGTWDRRLAPVALAEKALEAADALRTAAGHLVLRYAFRTQRWPEATTALRFLAEDFDAQTALVEKLQERVDLTEVAEDLRDFVSHLTGLDSDGRR